MYVDWECDWKFMMHSSKSMWTKHIKTMKTYLTTDTYIYVYTVYTHKSCNFWSLSYTRDKISIYTSGPGYTTEQTIYPFTN